MNRVARLRVLIVCLSMTLVGGLALSTGAAAAGGAVTPGGSFAANSDYCLGQCSDILPAGENGNETAAEILVNKLTGAQPAHTSDQLGKYDRLLYGYSNLTDSQINNFFNDSALGVPADQVASSIHPAGRTDVTIVRDKATGVPHITGTTRAGTEFGAGYAAGQDRLWLMDVLRHLGRGQLSSFVGGAPANRALEQSQWATSPYTQADLQAQLTNLANSGPQGAQALQDIDNYVAGINAYIASAKSSLSIPGEYVLTGNANALTDTGIQSFTPTDIVAIASLVGGLFGTGGGTELQSALVKEAAEAQYGRAKGDALWTSLREQNDPEAVTTLHDGQSFPYGQAPANPVGVAMPDPRTLTKQPIVQNPTGSAATAATPTITPSSTSVGNTAATLAAKKEATAKASTAQRNATLTPALSKLRGSQSKGVLQADMLSNPKHGMSNALLVSGKYTNDGHPVAVFGPQTGYFAPQLLMLEDLQGPGIDARGAAFAGLNFYVELGRGVDYSWSATSATQDVTDTYALKLCDPHGNPVTTDSTYYLDDGVCTPMQRLEVDDAWSPNIADSTPAGSYQLVTFRTNYGLVIDRATVGGIPVAYASQRSTYMHEVDSMIGFEDLNNPGSVSSPQTFQQAVSHIDYTFNWFYIDSRHIAYYNSGLNPVRAPRMDPNLPAWGDGADEWQAWNPITDTSADTPFSQHPNSIDQNYYVSWNNKQAPGMSAADGNFSYGSIQRVNLLNSRVKAMVDSGIKVTRASLVQAMEQAAGADLRGEDVLPELLQVINSQPITNQAQANEVAKLSAWAKSGAYLHPTSPTSKAYQDSSAIQIMDAWWPLLAVAEFEPRMGTNLTGALAQALSVNQSPSGGQIPNISVAGGNSFDQAVSTHEGSAFQFGWWGYVDKDIRSVLGKRVQDPLPMKFCGGGNLAQCRQVLLRTLTQAAAEPASQVYPGDANCAAGDQWCADSIIETPFGGITDASISWQNRPTFQQVVQYPAHRGDNITDLALGETDTATSYASSGLFGLGAGYVPGYAIDGNPATHWSSSGSASDQSITIDLGSTHTVGRAILNWGSDYGHAYKIEVSDDGANWRTVWSTTTGAGGTDNDEFTATSARYVRMQGITSGTGDGYDLYEFSAYSE